MATKPMCASLLRELAGASYQISPIAMGTNTDPIQPIEREHRTDCFRANPQTRHPVSIVTKGVLILRDLDLLTSWQTIWCM